MQQIYQLPNELPSGSNRTSTNNIQKSEYPWGTWST